MHPPRVYVRDGVNEFPSRHVRPVHCIYPYRIPIFECRPIARQGDHTPLPPLSFLSPLFLLRIRSAEGLLFFDPVRNFTSFFFSFSNLRSKIPSGYCSPSPSSRIHHVPSRAHPFKEGSRQIGFSLNKFQ